MLHSMRASDGRGGDDTNSMLSLRQLNRNDVRNMTVFKKCFSV